MIKAREQDKTFFDGGVPSSLQIIRMESSKDLLDKWSEQNCKRGWEKYAAAAAEAAALAAANRR